MSLPISKYQLRTRDGQIVPGVTINRNSEIRNIGFSATNNNIEKESANFEIASSLSFNASLPNSIDLRRILKMNWEGVGRARFKLFKDPNASAESNVGKLDNEDQLFDVLNRFFMSMANPMHQQKAKEIISGGPNAIEQTLSSFGWTIRPVPNPHSPGEFYNPVASGSIEIGQFIGKLATGIVPIEGDSFGRLHGVWSHHAQVIAGFQGLTRQEIANITIYLRDYIAGDSHQWQLWKLLFDSNGEGIHGNKFWRDLTENN